jgi:hypothetical protein
MVLCGNLAMGDSFYLHCGSLFLSTCNDVTYDDQNDASGGIRDGRVRVEAY